MGDAWTIVMPMHVSTSSPEIHLSELQASMRELQAQAVRDAALITELRQRVFLLEE